jgi:hypothetical protein
MNIPLNLDYAYGKGFTIIFWLGVGVLSLMSILIRLVLELKTKNGELK